jgi:hypothetical protein
MKLSLVTAPFRAAQIRIHQHGHARFQHDARESMDSQSSGGSFDICA